MTETSYAIERSVAYDGDSKTASGLSTTASEGRSAPPGGADLKLQVRGLEKRYGTSVALAPIDLDMRNGEFLTLLGPSGSGKTTLLMSIAGLVEPDAGELWLDGKIATYAPPNKRGIGMVFQNYALFPHLSVFENIAFPLHMRRLGKADTASAVRRVLDIVKLSGFGDRLPGQLSGGQQQRVALARCLVYQPSIILMDEPLGALDKNLRDHMQREIRQICSELAVSVLYVTHDQEEAMTMSDRICLMNEGRVEQIGTPSELYGRPRTIFAARFLGESNFLDGEVMYDEGQYMLLLPQKQRIVVDRAVSVGAAKVLVRPESIRLLDPHETADVAYDATVVRCLPAGAVTRLGFRLPEGTILSALALTGQATLPSLGARVRIGWSRHQMVVLGP